MSVVSEEGHSLANGSDSSLLQVTHRQILSAAGACLQADDDFAMDRHGSRGLRGPQVIDCAPWLRIALLDLLPPVPAATGAGGAPEPGNRSFPYSSSRTSTPWPEVPSIRLAARTRAAEMSRAGTGPRSRRNLRARGRRAARCRRSPSGRTSGRGRWGAGATPSPVSSTQTRRRGRSARTRRRPGPRAGAGPGRRCSRPPANGVATVSFVVAVRR